VLADLSVVVENFDDSGNLRFSFSVWLREPLMRTHRFGRKIKLPAAMAIKHQIRMRMAQYEVKRAEAEAAAEVFRGQPSLAVPSAVPATEINADVVSGRIRQL
jgi:hypothetical protein